jgi:hypothetical protein
VAVEQEERDPENGSPEPERAAEADALIGARPRAEPVAESIATAALSTIRDVSNEVGRLVRRTATRITDGTPVAPIVRAVLGEPALLPFPRHDGPAPDDDAWAARVADAEQALAIGVQRTTELHERYERVLAELREAREREQALQSEMAAMLERGCAEREAVSRRADDVATTAEAQRAAAARDAENARAALAALQQSSLAQRNELALSRSEVARLGRLAEDAQQAREASERDHTALRGRLCEAQERVRTQEVELARIAEEHRRAHRATLGELTEREARWQDELSSLRLEHEREQERARMLSEEAGRLRIESEAREKRERRLQEELSAVATRADADREETVRRAQEMVQAAEQARAAVSAELEALRASASSDRTRLMEEGAAERAAELATAHETIAELESARASAAIEFERTRTRLSEIEHELLAVQHENRLAQRQLDKLCTAHDDLVEDNVRATAFLEEARASEAQLRGRTEELQEQLRALESERTRLVGARELDAACEAAIPPVARASEAETEVKTLRAWTCTLESELAEARALAEHATIRETRLQDTLDAHERAEHDHAATLADAQTMARSLEEDRAKVVAELEALRTSMATAQRTIMEAEEETRVARAEAERLAVAHESVLAEKARGNGATPSPVAATRPAATAATQAPTKSVLPPTVIIQPDTRAVAILDTITAWPAVGGVEVHVIAPAEDGVVARFGEVAPGRCIVNLAAAGAIAAAASIREAGVAVPLWGAVVEPKGERGLSLGKIEVLTRPIDPDLVRSQIATIAPKNARLLAIGSDSSTFIALRQGLMKAGMSVSIAWDLKQATELLEIVRPHIVVLDLALPGRGAAALVAGLARVETPPVLVLLPGAPDRLAAFSTALGTLVPEDGARTPQNILRAVIDTKRDGA